ncbi:hypothetical protein NXW37_29600 [Bacteroides thetaiotaomicron]|nr:hypothetical protein [Bacteroides thetaiotaomicron]
MAHFRQWGGGTRTYICVRCNLRRIVYRYGIYFRRFDIQSFTFSFGSADGGSGNSGDVLFAPTTDGYKLRLYYVNNNCKIIGGRMGLYRTTH